ncbi:MAG: hypothetical protein VB022_00345 [Rikenellaceae bacterium]|nr:hypothetical protein [Rikenellaceae bacterium]
MKAKFIIFSLFLMFVLSPVRAQTVDSSSIIKAALDKANEDLSNREKIKSYILFEKYLAKCIRDSFVLYQDGLGRYYTDAFINTSPTLIELKKTRDTLINKSNAFLKSQDCYKEILKMPAKNEKSKKIIREKTSEIHKTLLATNVHYKELVEKDIASRGRLNVEILKSILAHSKERNQIVPYVSIIPLNDIRLFDETADGFLAKTEINTIKNQINYLSGIYYDKQSRRYSLKHYVREMPSDPKTENYKKEVELKKRIEVLKEQLKQILLQKNEIIANKYISNRIEDSIPIPVYSYKEVKLGSFFKQTEELETKHDRFLAAEKSLSDFLDKDEIYRKNLLNFRGKKVSLDDYSKRTIECFTRLEKENQEYVKIRRDREISLFECNMAALIHLIDDYHSRGEILDLSVIVKGEELLSINNLPEIYSLDVQINTLKRMIEQSVNDYFRIKYTSGLWNYILIKDKED